MKTKIIAQGAEAVILLDEKNNLIIKDRVSKSYRIPELDKKIIKQRTKAEKNLLEKASKIINAPDPFPLKEWNIIKMPFIDGEKLSEYLDKFQLEEQKQICRQIGKSIAKLHEKDIIHGDLTTSNMILVEDSSASQKDELNVDNKTKDISQTNINVLIKSLRKIVANPDLKQHQSSSKARVYFIDFGLGFISHKFEDKAVDLHLLKQALEAKHFKHWEILFEEIIKEYKKNKDSDKTLEQLEKVEKRGRYKH